MIFIVLNKYFFFSSIEIYRLVYKLIQFKMKEEKSCTSPIMYINVFKVENIYSKQYLPPKNVFPLGPYIVTYGPAFLHFSAILTILLCNQIRTTLLI